MAWIIPGVLLAVGRGKHAEPPRASSRATSSSSTGGSPPRPEATADELAVGVSTLLALRGIEAGTVDGTIVSSVVPQLTPEYAG